VEVSATPIKHTSDFKFANCTEDESNKIVCDPADLKEAGINYHLKIPL
jgi:hypothetical protein